MLSEILGILESLLLIVFLGGLGILVAMVIRVVSKTALEGDEYRPEYDPRIGLWRYHRQTRFQEKPLLPDGPPSEASPSGSRLGLLPRLLIGIFALVRGLARVVLVGPKTEKSEPLAKHDSEAEEPAPRRVAVLRFNAAKDVHANGDLRLAESVDEVLVNRDHFEEVVVIIDSPGGAVHGYGHAFALLQRLRDADLKLTACIDRIGASGGYLMALPAHQIIASPFALVGSIGVVAGIPNIRKLLEEHGVSWRLFVAGDRKRVVHFADEDGPDVKQYMDEKLEAIHRQFLEAIEKLRGDRVKLDEIRSGDHWTAQESIAKNLGLVDALQTSSEYLLERNRERALVFVDQRVDLSERLSSYFPLALESALEKFLGRTTT
ncbi:MAG: S49 family peptidase [Planctomycetota bacterium]